MATYQSYETARLLLKPTQLADAAMVLEILNSPKWLKYIGDRSVHTIAAAEAYITERMLPQLERLGFANYTVIRKEDNTKMGLCGLYDRAGLEGVDIGFAFLERYEKQGYAFESASKMKQLAFTEFELDYISAITTKDNIASQKLLERLEMKHTKMINLPDDEEELMFYEISR